MLKRIEKKSNFTFSSDSMRRYVAIAALSVGSMLVAPVAEASAIGYTSWGGFTWQGYGIPGGLMDGYVDGSGLTINDVGGQFSTYTGGICNWHFTATFTNRYGTVYKTLTQVNHSACNHIGSAVWNTGSYRAQPGQVCVRLYTAFTKWVAGACLNIS